MRASSHQPNMGKLFSDIQQRQPTNSSARQDPKNDVQSSRAGLLSSIKERQSPSESNGPPSKAGLFDAIKQRKPPSESNPVASRAGLMDSIKQRNPPPESNPAASRAGLMDSIKSMKPPENNMSSSRGKNSSSFATQSQPRPSRQDMPPSPREVQKGASSRESRERAFARELQQHVHIETNPPQPSPIAKPSTSRSPRDAMRLHRRRMEAHRARHGK